MVDIILSAGYNLELVGNWAGCQLDFSVNSINKIYGKKCYYAV